MHVLGLTSFIELTNKLIWKFFYICNKLQVGNDQQAPAAVVAVNNDLSYCLQAARTVQR